MFEINFSKYGINSALFLIIILLISLVCCSCLGGNCFSKEGMTNRIPTHFTNSNGETATLINNVITTFDRSGKIVDMFNITINSTREFYSNQTKKYALLINYDTTYTIIITDKNSNNITKYIATNSPTTNSPTTTESDTNRSDTNRSGNYNHYTGIQIPDTYYANGKILRVFYANGIYYITITDPVSGTIYYNSTAATDPASLTKYTFIGPDGGSAVIYTYNEYYAARVTDSNGQVKVYTTNRPTTSNNSEMYNNSNTNNNISGSIYPTAATGSSGLIGDTGDTGNISTLSLGSIANTANTAGE